MISFLQHGQNQVQQKTAKYELRRTVATTGIYVFEFAFVTC